MKILVTGADGPLARSLVDRGQGRSGLELVALWTLASLIFHAVRLAQATEQAARGRPVVSWLEA